MDQVWFGTRATSAPNGATRYNTVLGGLGWTATESVAQMVCSSAGTIKSLKVELETAPGASASWAFTLMVDGVASALTVTISDPDTSGSDLTNQVSISAGQTVSLRSVPSVTPASTHPKYTMIFTGSTDKESVIMAWGNVVLNSSTNQFGPLHVGVATARSTVELEMQQLCAGAGTIKNFYVKLSADPGDPGGPDGYRFTARKNGSSQTLTVTISADNTTGNDTTNSFTVAPGDLLSVLIEPLNAPSVTPRPIWGVTFVADTDGQSLLLGGSDDDPNGANTEHNHIVNFPDGAWGSGESAVRTILDKCVFKNLYVELENTPGSGNSYVISTRRLTNSSASPGDAYSDGNLTVTISNSATTGNDTSNTDEIAAGESVVIQSNPDSSPTLGQVKWGVVMFIEVGTNAGTSTVTSNPPRVSADGAGTSTITVTLLDANSDPVVGNTVTLAQGAGSSVISAASGTSDSNGVVTFTVTNTTVETVTYTATDTTVSVTITQTANVVFLNPDSGSGGDGFGFGGGKSGEGSASNPKGEGVGLLQPAMFLGDPPSSTVGLSGFEQLTHNLLVTDGFQGDLDDLAEHNEVVIESG